MGIICYIGNCWQPDLELQALEGPEKELQQELRACAGEAKSTLICMNCPNLAFVSSEASVLIIY